MSTSADTYVRARIDTHTKERAAIALEAMGFSSLLKNPHSNRCKVKIPATH